MIGADVGGDDDNGDDDIDDDDDADDDDDNGGVIGVGGGGGGGADGMGGVVDASSGDTHWLSGLVVSFSKYPSTIGLLLGIRSLGPKFPSRRFSTAASMPDRACLKIGITCSSN